MQNYAKKSYSPNHFNKLANRKSVDVGNATELPECTDIVWRVDT